VWTLCGLPIVCAPVLEGPRGLPIGAQLVARRYNDYRLFALLDHLTARGLLPTAPSPAPRARP
jgi:Asp-tRNA(Asn)/Glu-tRNA(Gln) amidotransferase A subunit family amidase